MRILTLLLLIGALYTVPLLAQDGTQSGMGPGSGGGFPGAVVMNEQDTIRFFAVMLQLSNSQQQQLRTIFDQAIQNAKPLQEPLRKAMKSLLDAAMNGKSESDLGKLAAQQASLSSQLLVLQAETLSKVSRVLNADQRAQMDSGLFEMIGAMLGTASTPSPDPSTPTPSVPPQTGAAGAPISGVPSPTAPADWSGNPMAYLQSTHELVLERFSDWSNLRPHLVATVNW